VDIVDVVKRVLEEQRPENVDTSAVTVTGEGDKVKIVIVPHRDLGGVSLVLWTDENGTQLSWAGVGDLSTHDDIDLGAFVTRILHEGSWTARLRDALADELRRPIRLRYRQGLFGGQRIDCFVAIDHREKRLAVLRPMSPPRAVDPSARETVTSLATRPPLPFAIPPPVENWRRYK
jgi:hypothetical protein